MLQAPTAKAEYLYVDLLNACSEGNLERIEELLQIDDVQARLSELTTTDYYFLNGLIAAAVKGHLAVVNRLLEIPAIVDNVTVYDNYVLCLAAQPGRIDIVNRLLEIPAVKEKVTAQNSGLLHASFMGHLSVVNRLLQVAAVCQSLQDNPPNFIDVFHNILNCINNRYNLVDEFDNEGNAIFKQRLDAPNDVEIHIVKVLFKIAQNLGVSLATELNDAQKSALDFCYPTGLFTKIHERREVLAQQQLTLLYSALTTEAHGIHVESHATSPASSSLEVSADRRVKGPRPE